MQICPIYNANNIVFKFYAFALNIKASYVSINNLIKMIKKNGKCFTFNKFIIYIA